MMSFEQFVYIGILITGVSMVVSIFSLEKVLASIPHATKHLDSIKQNSEFSASLFPVFVVTMLVMRLDNGFIYLILAGLFGVSWLYDLLIGRQNYEIQPNWVRLGNLYCGTFLILFMIWYWVVLHANYGMLLFYLGVLSAAIWIFDFFYIRKHLDEEPLYVDYAKSFLPILAIIFFARSFLFEPFRIPSGSMKPTLWVGDFIFVNKFAYGLRWPSDNSKLMDVNLPEHGDIVVFKFPNDDKTDYIKRVVGLPGDTVMYKNKALYILKKCESGQKCEPQKIKQDLVARNGHMDNGAPLDVYTEYLNEAGYTVAKNRAPQRVYDYRYTNGALSTWVVPEGHYFVMGDNRDNSNDSRFWGFVPEENLVGQATAIWMHVNIGNGKPWSEVVKLGRIGSIQ
jgi:signal peptidase I